MTTIIGIFIKHEIEFLNQNLYGIEEILMESEQAKKNFSDYSKTITVNNKKSVSK